MVKSVIGVLILAALASPAFANEYWVEYDYSKHQCSVVEKKSQQNPQESAAPGNSTPTVAPSTAANSGNTPTMLPPSSAPAQTRTVVTPPTNDSTASASPTTASSKPTTTPAAPSSTDPDDTKKDPYGATAAAWAQKKAAAEAAGTADNQTALIGTAQHSRAEAESEMQIMRKCGIAN